jgi:uncharacterized OB-fold protein/acyl dehydratase
MTAQQRAPEQAGPAAAAQVPAGQAVDEQGPAGQAVTGHPAAVKPADSGAPAIRAAAARIAAAGESPPRRGRDPVNLPMIRNWAEALGDANPVYTDPAAAAHSVHGGLVAPPAMAQVWTMGGLHPAPSARGGDPLQAMSEVLDEAGFTSVVATNCEQEYRRYLRPGDEVSVRSVLEDVTGPKRTALGEGWFVTTRSTWYAGTEPVATMLFRILKYRPAPRQDRPGPPASAPAASPPAAAGASGVLRPVVSPDTAFFWAGTQAGELRIQRCGGCGALRHPPGPRCPACGVLTPTPPGYVVAAGTGEVYSYVVHHHPPVPGRRLPVVVALVTLTEGVRMVGELIGTAPDRVRIGLPVRVAFTPVDEGLTLPAWREDVPAAAGTALPELVVEASTTFVITSALATRDFQDVHHDRDAAIARGSQDIFVNILTTTGLVQRFVTDWAGPQALVRSVAIRLGVPCYAGDTLTFTGEASPQAADAPDGGTEYLVRVTGQGRLGDHVTGTVRVLVPGEPA